MDSPMSIAVFCDILHPINGFKIVVLLLLRFSGMSRIRLDIRFEASGSEQSIFIAGRCDISTCGFLVMKINYERMNLPSGTLKVANFEGFGVLAVGFTDSSIFVTLTTTVLKFGLEPINVSRM